MLHENGLTKTKASLLAGFAMLQQSIKVILKRYNNNYSDLYLTLSIIQVL